MTADVRTGLDRRQRVEPWPFPERRVGERRRVLAGVPAVEVGGGFPWPRLLTVLADPWFRIFAAVVACGQLLDLLTTYYALASGRFQEGNPIFGGAVDAHSGVVVLTKLVVALGVVVVSALEISSVGRRRLAVGLVALISLAGPIPNLLRVAGLI